MKLQFLQSTALDVVTAFDEQDEIVESSPETFAESEQVDVELLVEDDEKFLVQFGDGSVAEISKHLVEVTQYDDEVAADAVSASPVLSEDAVANTESLNDTDDDGLLTPEERAQLAEELAASKQTQHQQPEQ